MDPRTQSSYLLVESQLSTSGPRDVTGMWGLKGRKDPFTVSLALHTRSVPSTGTSGKQDRGPKPTLIAIHCCLSRLGTWVNAPVRF